MNIIDSMTDTASPDRPLFHRSRLKTEAVAEIPAIKGVLVVASKKHEHPDWADFRDRSFQRQMERPPWFCVWPRTGIAALGMPPVRMTLVRFQSSRVWINPDHFAPKKFDPGWRMELGFDESLGDRRVQARDPSDLARTPVTSQTCTCHGDGGGSASFTFTRCHQIWIVADWTSGRELSIVGCEYILDREGP